MNKEGQETEFLSTGDLSLDVEKVAVLMYPGGHVEMVDIKVLVAIEEEEAKAQGMNEASLMPSECA